MKHDQVNTEGPWSLGEIDGNFRDIDRPDHGAVMRIVWKMEDDKERSPACEALAHEVVATLNAASRPRAVVVAWGYVDERGQPVRFVDDLHRSRMKNAVEFGGLELLYTHQAPQQEASPSLVAAAGTALEVLEKHRRRTREPAPDGNWLWVKLMDFCKKRGFAPAEFNDLFAIVKDARAAAQSSATWDKSATKAEVFTELVNRVMEEENYTSHVCNSYWPHRFARALLKAMAAAELPVTVHDDSPSS